MNNNKHYKRAILVQDNIEKVKELMDVVIRHQGKTFTLGCRGDAGVNKNTLTTYLKSEIDSLFDQLNEIEGCIKINLNDD